MTKLKKPALGTLRMGALVVLSGCFVLSAILRAGDVVAELPAKGDDGFGNPLPKQATSEPTSAQTVNETTTGPEALLDEVRRQREALQAREADVAARERALNGLGTQMRQRLDELRAARDGLAKTAALVDDAAGKDVRLLADMYQQMKPKQAGQIFNEMAPSFAAGFIANMRPDAAALVMANMDAEKAYAVSLLLAGRNVNRRPAAAPAAAAQRPASQ
ncbi:MAG: MotE family protein [Paracoccaceae bacterium]